MDAHTRSFDDADESLRLPRLRSDVVHVGSLGISRNVHEPGWRWSADVSPAVGTVRCETRHVGYCLRGQLAVELEDGTYFEVASGQVFDIPPGHDGWVVGDEPFETIEWLGAKSWLSDHATLQERRLATVLFTDLVASTVTAQRLGASAWGDLLASYENIMRDTVAAYRGTTVKFTGDGVLAMFDGTARAIRCAVAMRAAAEDLGLPTRAALHTGEIEVTADDIHGIAIHEAARMLGLAGDGDILVSATTRTLVTDAGVELEDRGEHELRGLEGPRRLFALR